MTIRRIAAGFLVWLACQTTASVYANQDALSNVRELYLAADYEGALAVLDRLDSDARDKRLDLADYRVLCLLALDRTDAARQAIKSIVEADPFHQLSEVQASPRMRAVFQETRKALLPDLVHRMYAEAKTSFDKQDPSAAHQFDRLIALFDDPDLKDAQLSDLRAVASGFRDLSKAPSSRPEDAPASVAVANGRGGTPDTPAAAARKPDMPAPVRLPPSRADNAAKPTGPLTGPPDKIRVSSRGSSPLFTPKELPPAGFEPPIAISQAIPSWSRRGSASQQTSTGIVAITIDEQGNVTTAAIQQPIQPAFDQALLKAARSWKYKPALLNGTPVSFLKLIEIQIQPDR